MNATVSDVATPSGKHAGTENFPVGSLLLRACVRPHVHAFYRFARMADDIADNPALTAEEKIRRLDLMEAVLLDEKRHDVPVAAAMRQSLRATAIAPVHCRDLLTAFRMDAVKQRYADWADLMNYCRYSASPVGRQLLDLHGESILARGPSDALCSALQVINHLQDCALDYREMDRVYVPLDHLGGVDADLACLAAPKANEKLRRALDRLLDETEALMRDARRLPSSLADFRLRAESAVIVALADRLIGLLRRRDPLAMRVRLGKAQVFAATLQGIGWALLTRGQKTGRQT